ncbi:efflux RND transporter periplasmic adaptor subunit [uncultured Roseovarius sp.]|uniref:efflux RND transporter periplasmic adaptor subunit n=1 Tax=uncultured Roseovarius sp. TaxID=293344 RepID=UPI002625BFDA|nr:efflux RND transporter periplasmic adaptor subunit [uncultured Roseovarius sp.]
MPIWKQLLVLCMLAGAAYGGYEAYQVYLAPQAEVDKPQRGARPVSVEVARAERRLMQKTIEAVGTTRAMQSIDIVPETDGRLVDLAIRPGTEVTKGDILAQLDDTIQRADLAEAEAVLVEQRQTLDRTRLLRQTNAVSQASEEEAVARLAEAEAEVERARRRLSDRVITAPFSGVVGLTNYTIGARVTEGQVLTRLDDLNQVEVEFSLPETVFARVRQGQAIIAHSAAFADRSFTGTVDVVDSRIDPLSRSFRARALIPNPDSALPAGMFLSLTLVLEESEQITVPEEALIFQAAETYVFVPEDGKASRRVVIAGQRKDGQVSIISGLESGEEVLIRGLQRVRDGTPLNIIGSDRDATAATDDAKPESAT